MKILIVNIDQLQNDYLLTALSKHKVTVTYGWKHGLEALSAGEWDMFITNTFSIVETDSSGCIKKYASGLGLEAIKAGIPRVIVINNHPGDTTHHSQSIYWSNNHTLGQLFQELRIEN